MTLGRPKKTPTVYTEEQLKIAIELAVEGKPLKEIIDAMFTNEYDFWHYKINFPEFSNKFENARQEGLEHLADQLIKIDETYTDVQRARLKSDNYKWLLSKRKPMTYGDRIDVNVNQTVDISMALNEAKERTKSLRDVTPVLVGGMPVKLKADESE